QRIAQSFKLSVRLVHRCATYQHMRGPQMFSAASARAIRAAAPAVQPAALSAAVPAIDVPPTSSAAPTIGVPAASSAAPTIAAPAAPQLAAAPEPAQLTAHPQEELDLIARGIAKAIAAASAPSFDRQSGRR